MNEDIYPEGQCRQCGKPVAADQSYCSQCMVERLEEHIPEPVERPVTDIPDSASRVKTVIAIFILLCLITITAFQAPVLISAFKADQPIRKGSDETDAGTDQCVANLWRVARMLQDGQMPGKTLVCPVSGEPYLVIKKGADILARCPNPEIHGVSEIRVSARSPRPEVEP